MYLEVLNHHLPKIIVGVEHLVIQEEKQLKAVGEGLDELVGEFALDVGKDALREDERWCPEAFL